MTQTVAALLLLAAAVAYAARRAYTTLSHPACDTTACDGCPLKNKDCSKKTAEKFGRSK